MRLPLNPVAFERPCISARGVPRHGSAEVGIGSLNGSAEVGIGSLNGSAEVGIGSLIRGLGAECLLQGIDDVLGPLGHAHDVVAHVRDQWGPRA